MGNPHLPFEYDSEESLKIIKLRDSILKDHPKAKAVQRLLIEKRVRKKYNDTSQYKKYIKKGRLDLIDPETRNNLYTDISELEKAFPLYTPRQDRMDEDTNHNTSGLRPRVRHRARKANALAAVSSLTPVTNQEPIPPPPQQQQQQPPPPPPPQHQQPSPSPSSAFPTQNMPMNISGIMPFWNPLLPMLNQVHQQGDATWPANNNIQQQFTPQQLQKLLEIQQQLQLAQQLQSPQYLQYAQQYQQQTSQQYSQQLQLQQQLQQQYQQSGIPNQNMNGVSQDSGIRNNNDSNINNNYNYNHNNNYNYNHNSNYNHQEDVDY